MSTDPAFNDGCSCLNFRSATSSTSSRRTRRPGGAGTSTAALVSSRRTTWSWWNVSPALVPLLPECLPGGGGGLLSSLCCFKGVVFPLDKILPLNRAGN